MGLTRMKLCCQSSVWRVMGSCPEWSIL